VGETVAAKKAQLGPTDALALAKKVTTIVAARGKRVEKLDVKTADEPAILVLLLGPTGTLRAPTAVVGKTLLVGFHPDAYAEVLG
jgi:arsenate reductase-like glutaredoxin family protein